MICTSASSSKGNLSILTSGFDKIKLYYLKIGKFVTSGEKFGNLYEVNLLVSNVNKKLVVFVASLLLFL